MTVSVVPYPSRTCIEAVVIGQKFVKLFLELDGQAVAAGEHSLQAAQVRAVHGGKPQQRLVKRGDAGDEVAMILYDLLGIALRGKARDQYAATALGEHCMDANTQSKAVEKRHGGEHPVADGEHWVGGEHLLTEGIKVFIG